MAYTIRMTRFAGFLLALCFLSPASAAAAVLYLDPSEETYGVGDTFVMNVRLDSQDECINAVGVRISYPRESLKAVDFSRGSSILTLWVEEPQIDTELGTVTFSGGIPGGYCGRIPGDAVVTNIVGKVVFTVLDATARTAAISLQEGSQALLNDGTGTPAELELVGSTIALSSERQTTSNPWLDVVRSDDIAPDSFQIIVESTRGIFGGRYYIAFSTIDKQSGLDHYEIYERGAWKTISSPYELRDQSLRSLQVKAIDKAGNERMGEYIEGSAPPRARPAYGIFSIVGLFGLLLILIIVKRLMDRRKDLHDAPPLS